jgi:hypothetical protein
MITGAIDEADVSHFKEIVSPLTSLDGIEILVEVNSPGGKVIPAMEIGNIIRDNWLWTSLVINDPTAVCYSSCVLIFAAGAVRIQPDLPAIGIHRPFFEAELFAGLDKTEAKQKYDALLSNVRLYLGKMGMAPELYQAMIQVPSNELRNLTAAEIRNWNISGDDPAYTEYRRAQNVAKYGQAKMHEFDDWRKSIDSCMENCRSNGKALEACAKDCDIKYPNPISDWGKR